MIIILVRHGERGMMNDALTPRGVQQAKSLANRLIAPPWSIKNVPIYSSPKERCAQTSAEIQQIIGGELKVLAALEECRGNESSPTFFQRVKDFFVELQAHHDQGAIVVVSHSDWLEAAAEELWHSRPTVSWLQGSAHVVEILKGKASYRSPV